MLEFCPEKLDLSPALAGDTGVMLMHIMNALITSAHQLIKLLSSSNIRGLF